VHGIAFHARREFYEGFVGQFLDEAVDDLTSEVAVSHLTALETQAGFYLVALGEESESVILLGLEVMLVNVDAELDLFELDVLLGLLGGFVLLALLVKELAIVLNAADGRLRGGGDLHEVQAFVFGCFYGFEDRQDANLFAFGADNANFAGADTVIYADKTLIDAEPPSCW
jgi:hypothetical protein